MRCLTSWALILAACWGSAARADITWSGDIIPANPTIWTNLTEAVIAATANGTVTVVEGSDLLSNYALIADSSGSTGRVAVDGVGSTWTIDHYLDVGENGSGTLTIIGGGMVSVAGRLFIAPSGDAGDSFVNMKSGGVLALAGDADDSLVQFLDLVSGTDAIRYWDKSLADWALITAATYGDDYTLSYLTSGKLNGYTLLTVGTLPRLPGDYNGNGTVDAADYSVWRDHLGQTFTLPNEDPGTTPGQVTAEDYEFWKSHFGQTAGSGSGLPSAASQSVVPEPSTVMLLILAAASALIMHNRVC